MFVTTTWATRWLGLVVAGQFADGTVVGDPRGVGRRDELGDEFGGHSARFGDRGLDAVLGDLESSEFGQCLGRPRGDTVGALEWDLQAAGQVGDGDEEAIATGREVGQDRAGEAVDAEDVDVEDPSQGVGRVALQQGSQGLGGPAVGVLLACGSCL
ncbi:hypothetical protein KIH74_34885 [Kineosporia sp. J2-2]|uniref:Uncharacterized protein n=1 Tax=Kineosporia corallincola TaxID=2835133 RepID=A0ABS5TTP8_9ACTN|nr:hypothetical protein [Kineosporia corallincola]MBT0774184.1 hypothetical protein [Kineosporia corallincola]